MRMLSRKKHFAFVATSIVLSILAVLTLLETILRMQAYWDDRKNSEAFQNLAKVNMPSDYHGPVNWHHCIRMSKNPKIIYELIPNLSVELTARRFNTNFDGFRSPPYSVAKDNATFRIIGLGDSVMFGWAVHDEQTYLSLLNDKLNEKLTNITWQVINTAVPGYNTVMEVETLKEKGLKYRPDLVIVGFINNDFSLPNFIRLKKDFFTFKESYLLGVLRPHMKRSLQTDDIGGPLIKAPRDDTGRSFEFDPQKVPKEYRDMVGLEAFFKAMRELKSLSERHGFSILVFTMAATPKYVQDIASELDIPVITASRSIREYMGKNRIKSFGGSVMTVSEKDHHPSALTHEIMMNVLFDHIKDNVLSIFPQYKNMCRD